MPKTVTASAGETLCQIAVENGFADCNRLRAEAANAALLARELQAGDRVFVPDVNPGVDTAPTETLSRFVRRGRPFASIRFVHGTQNLPFESDPTLRELNVSNYVTDRAGADGTAAFVDHNHRVFDANAHEDEDTFKVEVLDVRTTRNDLDVTLEALRPRYVAGRLDRHEQFPAGAERTRRSLAAQVTKMAGSRRFRSCYMRLVVDDVDRASRPQQTLLTTDFVPTDREVEILDQDVRAEYVLDGCPAPAAQRCRVSRVVSIRRGGVVRVAVRVCRAAASGVTETVVGGPGDNGVVGLTDIRRRFDTFSRRHWAQAHVRFRFDRLETVDLPSNMLTVADTTGNLSNGQRPAGGGVRGQVSFRLNVQRFGGQPNATHNVGPIQIAPGRTPKATADAIAAAINALPSLRAEASLNPTEAGDARGSADVIIRDTLGGRVTITNLSPVADQDRDQLVQAINVTLTVRFRNSGRDYHVGHPEQRNLVKFYNSASDRVLDITVVTTVPGTRGFTVPELNSLRADRHTFTGVRNSIIMPTISTDSSNNNPFSLPHEIGHILNDDGLHATVNTELMRSGTSGTSTATTDSKRIWGRSISTDNWELQTMNADGTIGSNTARLNAVARIHRVSNDLIA